MNAHTPTYMYVYAPWDSNNFSSPSLPSKDLADSDAITELLKQAGGERETSGNSDTLTPSPSSPEPISILSPSQFNSISIDLEEFGSARAKSKSL